MRLLELFSGTHSIGKVADNLGFEVISLDRDLGGECPFKTDYKSDIHIKEDIMKWNYKIYNKGDFDIITASPVCLFWSSLRNTWIGRKSKTINPNGEIVKKEDIQRDIDLYGKPMVDKVFEIIEYFEPKYWWIENPQTGRMKTYISESWSQYDNFYDVSYCKYSDYGYEKKTRFWTNIKGFKPLICYKDCKNIITIPTQKNKVSKNHKLKGMPGGGSNRLFRYRIPEKLIEELFLCIL